MMARLVLVLLCFLSACHGEPTKLRSRPVTGRTRKPLTAAPLLAETKKSTLVKDDLLAAKRAHTASHPRAASHLVAEGKSELVTKRPSYLWCARLP